MQVSTKINITLWCWRIKVTYCKQIKYTKEQQLVQVANELPVTAHYHSTVDITQLNNDIHTADAWSSMKLLSINIFPLFSMSATNEILMEKNTMQDSYRNLTA